MGETATARQPRGPLVGGPPSGTGTLRPDRGGPCGVGVGGPARRRARRRRGGPGSTRVSGQRGVRRVMDFSVAGARLASAHRILGAAVRSPGRRAVRRRWERPRGRRRPPRSPPSSANVTVRSSSSAPRTTWTVTSRPSVGVGQRRLEVGGPGDVAGPDAGDEVAGGQPGAGGRAAVGYAAHQGAVPLGEADGPSHAPGGARRGDADAEHDAVRAPRRRPDRRRGAAAPRPAGWASANPSPSRRVVSPTMRPSASTTGLPDVPLPSGAVCSMAPVTRRPRGPRNERSTADTAPCGDAAAPGDGGHRVDGRALGRGGVGPGGGGDAAGVDGQDGQVAVGVDGGGPALGRPGRRRR